MSEPVIKLGLVANLFSRMMHFKKAGDIELGHKHQFDHLTLLALGAVKVVVDGIATDFYAPHMIYINKDKNHEITALQDNTVAYCIHALRSDNLSNTILDPDSIPGTATRKDILNKYTDTIISGTSTEESNTTFIRVTKL